jgi:hypothetical protein
MARRLGLATACMASVLVPLVVSMSGLYASVPTDETFTPTDAMALPAGPTGCIYPPPYISPAPCKPLQSFDISYVGDAIYQVGSTKSTHAYYLLADRSNAAIDVFDAQTNSFVKFLQPTDSFAGVQPASVPTGSGPNGVVLIPGIILNPPPNCTVGCFHGSNGKTVNMVWAGDAPAPSGSTGTSHLKVMDLDSGATLAVLNTLGVRRADELCFATLPSGAPDPANPYVLVANDNNLDNYLTIWRWDNFQFVERINLTGNDPLAAPYNPNAANGIEQCKFNPRNKSFYLAIPATQSHAITSFGTLTGGTLYTNGAYSNVSLTGGTGTGATANITVAGGTVTAVTLVSGGNGYTVGDSLSALASSIGGTGSGFSILVATVGPGVTTDGFVLKISLPKMPSPWIPLTSCAPGPNCQYGKVVAAYEIFPGGTGCGVANKGAGPAGLSIGPSFNGTNTNGLIALGCGAGSVGSLIIDDFANTILSVPFTNSTDETWYDPATNHFFFAQSGTSPAFGSLGVVDANEYPPLSYLQEDGDDTGGAPVKDPTAVAATGSHSVAVYPGACSLPSPAPTRLSRVYVPARSTLTAGAASTFCSSLLTPKLGAFPATGAAPQWPGGTAQAPTAITWDQWGCIAVYTAPATCSNTGHASPKP